MKLSLDVVVLGALTGLTYAIMAMGLVLIYRAQRFINFAQGQLGTVAVVLFGKMVIDLGIPYWLALIAALAAAAALGGIVEIGIIRPLSKAPRLVLIAEGHPTDVLKDPNVIASYLGTDQAAILRSGARPDLAASNGTTSPSEFALPPTSPAPAVRRRSMRNGSSS